MNPLPPTTIGPAWEALRDRLDGGTVLVIGQSGVGKSHLVRYLAGELAARGRRVGLLSTDMGQASVGPPGCLGLALDPAGQHAAALWFIGDTTPVKNLLPAVVGAARLAQRARQHGIELLLIDTTGLATGPLGRVLKYHKALAAGADQVIAVQRAGELEPLLALVEGPCPIIHRMTPAAAAHDRTPAERTLYRRARFQAHFRNGALRAFSAERLIAPDWAPLAFSGTPVPARNTVVGLLDRQGFCLALGIIEEVRADQVMVYTAWRDVAAVNRLQTGRLRLDREGEELPRCGLRRTYA